MAKKLIYEELEKVEEAFSEIEKRYQRLIENSPDMLYRLSLPFLESVDCSEIMNECLDIISPLAEDKKISLDLKSFDPLMRLRVRADRNRLKQILINLLSNAVKYNSREGTVRIAAVIHEKVVRIMVTNTGPGIPVDKLGELFIPFNRLGKEAGTIPGTGIGLTFSKRLAKQMKGDVGLESTGDKGSCFRVELPLMEVNDSLSE